MAVEVTDRQLTCQCLPDLLQGPSMTVSDSTHRLEFRATLFHWNTFEKEVRQGFLSVPWNGRVVAYEPSEPDPSRAHIHYEQLYCGDEHSVVARFGQNVEHVMSAVYSSIGIRLHFGDYKASVDKDLDGKVPDIVLMDDTGHIKVIGEVKTPWKHVISDNMQEARRFRNYLGQISQYMYLTKIKYGFLTTYEQTMFLKQVPDPRKGKEEEWVLFHSNVIRHNTKSDMSLGSRERRNLYTGKVSVRECFLFLAKEALSHDSKVKNSMERNDWFGPMGGRSYNDDDYISPSDDSSESQGSTSTSPSPPPPGQSASGGPPGSTRRLETTEKRSQNPQGPVPERTTRSSRPPRETTEKRSETQRKDQGPVPDRTVRGSRPPRETTERRSETQRESSPERTTRSSRPPRETADRPAEGQRRDHGSLPERTRTRQQPSQEASEWPAPITVFRHPRRNQWCYKEPSGRIVPVPLIEDKDSEEETRYYFMRDGKRQYVERDGQGK